MARDTSLETSIKEAVALFRRHLRDFQTREGLNATQAAEALGVSKKAVLNWRKGRLPKGDLLDQIGSKLGLSDDDKTIILNARTLRAKLARRGRSQKSSLQSPPRKKMSESVVSPEVSDPLQLNSAEEKLAQLREGLTKLLKETSLNSVRDHDLEQHWAEGGVQFQLTSYNFVPLDVRCWTDKDTLETRQVILEVIKRLAYLAQCSPDQRRQDILKALSRDLDELTKIMIVAGSVVPFQCLKMLEDRQLLQFNP